VMSECRIPGLLEKRTALTYQRGDARSEIEP
jgi:hypothetical protein